MKKKAQLSFNSTPQVVIAIILTGILLAVGAIGFDAFRENSYTTVTGDTNSFTALNSTSVVFGKGDVAGDSCTSVTIVNASSVDHTSDFTVSGCSATLTNNGYNNTAHTATYTAEIVNQVTTIMNDSSISVNNVSDQLPTVGTMVGVGLILIIVIGVFAFVMMRK